MESLRPLKKAWLITWEWSGEHARVAHDKKIVSVLNSRWTGKRVRDLVELLYASFAYTVWDKAAITNNAQTNKYPATFDQIDDVPWEGQVHCGHNPWLYARQVRNFTVVIGDDGIQRATWDELPRPKPQVVGVPG